MDDSSKDGSFSAVPLVKDEAQVYGNGKYAYLTPKVASGKVKFVISTNSKTGEQALVGTDAIPVGTWTHVAVTLQGDVGTLYVDGKPVRIDVMRLRPFDLLS